VASLAVWVVSGILSFVLTYICYITPATSAIVCSIFGMRHEMHSFLALPARRDECALRPCPHRGDWETLGQYRGNINE
jgi:hypothetical protein